MDYKKLMEGEVKFSDIYESGNEKIEDYFEIGEIKNLKNILKDKRNFGLEKYKEYSFQASFENCMKSPTVLHAQEEVIDLINYLLHEYYKQNILCSNYEPDRSATAELINLISASLKIYKDLEYLKSHI